MGLKRALLALLCLIPAGSLAGQEALREAWVRADLMDAAVGARIRVEYVIAGVAPGDSVTASILTFGSSTPSALAVGAGGAAADFRAGPGRAMAALLPVERGPDGQVRVVAEYVIASAVTADGPALRGHLPVLSLDVAPAEARPGLFSGEIIAPSDWAISEAFPTGLHEISSEEGSSRTWGVDLPVVPATVSFRAYTDGRWHPGLPFMLDVVAAFIILGFSFVGWRHIRAGPDAGGGQASAQDPPPAPEEAPA